MAAQRLTRPRSEVELLLEDLIAQGQQLVEDGRAVQSSFARFTSRPQNLEDLQTWVRHLERWHAFGRDGLASVYEDEEVPSEFYEAAQGFVYRRVNQDLAATIINRIAATEGGVNTLLSLTERLRFAEEPASVSATPAATVAPDSAETIFVVHGHDVAAKYEVARFLEQIKGPEVVLLEEQPDRGRTIIEKFEDHAASAGYAVVLLTGDDEARERGAEVEELRRRARQNVILELGFFIGKLGRARVAMLYEEGVERPSDIDGVLVLLLDSPGAWKMKLAAEMRAAGVALDPEAVLRA